MSVQTQYEPLVDSTDATASTDPTEAVLHRPVGDPVTLYTIPLCAVASMIAVAYPSVVLALRTF